MKKYPQPTQFLEKNPWRFVSVIIKFRLLQDHERQRRTTGSRGSDGDGRDHAVPTAGVIQGCSHDLAECWGCWTEPGGAAERKATERNENSREWLKRVIKNCHVTPTPLLHNHATYILHKREDEISTVARFPQRSCLEICLIFAWRRLLTTRSKTIL